MEEAERASKYNAIVPFAVIGGEDHVLASTVATQSRKFLKDFGGFDTIARKGAKTAMFYLERATYGLLGSTAKLRSQVVVRNRARVPDVGFAWAIDINPGLCEVLVQQHKSVSCFLTEHTNFRQEISTNSLRWVKVKDLLLGHLSCDIDPTFLKIMRFLSQTRQQKLRLLQQQQERQQQFPASSDPSPACEPQADQQGQPPRTLANPP